MFSSYRKISNISRTESSTLTVSRLVLQLSFPNPMKPGVSREWRCSWSSADRRCSNYIWVIDNFIAYQGAPYIRDLTVVVSCHHGITRIRGTQTTQTCWKMQKTWSSSSEVYYYDVRMSAIASQLTSLTIVYSTVYSDADQRKHQSSASLASVWGIHRWPVNFPHKGPVTRKMFPFDDVIITIKIMTLLPSQQNWNHHVHQISKKS